MAEMMYRDALNRALFEEMRKDPLIFIMGENIGWRGGSYKVTEGLLNEFGPERVIDTPIAEASFTGAAVGAALVGTRPIVEILFIDFALLAMDQIINQAAKYEFMSGGQDSQPMAPRPACSVRITRQPFAVTFAGCASTTSTAPGPSVLS